MHRVGSLCGERKKQTPLRELVHKVLNTEEGKELLERLYQREVLGGKNYESPTILANQCGRSDLILELVQTAKIPESLLKTYTELEKANPIERADMLESDI